MREEGEGGRKVREGGREGGKEGRKEGLTEGEGGREEGEAEAGKILASLCRCHSFPYNLSTLTPSMGIWGSVKEKFLLVCLTLMLLHCIPSHPHTPHTLTGEGAGSSDAIAQVRLTRRLYWSHRH